MTREEYEKIYNSLDLSQGSLASLWKRLDELLTGEGQPLVEHNLRQKALIFASPEALVEFLCGDVYYLSDGGYSRVGMTKGFGDMEPGKLYPTYSSTDKVKHRWYQEEVQKIVKEIEERIQKAALEFLGYARPGKED